MRTKYKFDDKKMKEKITFSVDKNMRENINKRCDELHLNTISDYLRQIISKDLKNNKNKKAGIKDAD